MNKEVDIFIIPKQQPNPENKLKAKDFFGKFSHLELNDFMNYIEKQRLEWERNI